MALVGKEISFSCSEGTNALVSRSNTQQSRIESASSRSQTAMDGWGWIVPIWHTTKCFVITTILPLCLTKWLALVGCDWTTISYSLGVGEDDLSLQHSTIKF